MSNNGDGEWAAFLLGVIIAILVTKGSVIVATLAVVFAGLWAYEYVIDSINYLASSWSDLVRRK